MSDSEIQFELLEFEQVEAAPGTVLLRVACRLGSDTAGGDLALVIEEHGIEHRLEQLPTLPGPPGLIRAAFSAPHETVGEGANYSLALPDGQLVQLPTPSRRRTAASAEPGHGAEAAGPTGGHAEGSDSDSSRLAEAERRAESRRLAIAELERRLQSERERRSAAESDLANVRNERDEARAERDAALSDRDEALGDRDEAEGRARTAAANAGAVEAQVRATADSATRAQAALEAELAERVGELERMRSAAEVAQARAHASRRDLTALDEQLAHAQAQVTVLQAALDERGAEQLASRASMDDAVSSARDETSGLRERLAALEEELAAERELAARTGTQHGYDLDTAQSRIDSAQAEAEVARAETEALRSRGTAHEATLAQLDAALARRAAEIELLREAVITRGSHAGAGAAGLQGVAGAPDLDARSDARGQAPPTASAGAVTPDGGGISETEVESLLAQARSEGSSVLVAEVELLRAQVQEHRHDSEQARQALESAASRADDAEARVRELNEAVRTETEKRVLAESALAQATTPRSPAQQSLSLDADSDEA